jgi:hypothetical protein
MWCSFVAGMVLEAESISECVEPVVPGQATRFYPAEVLLAFVIQVLQTLASQRTTGCSHDDGHQGAHPQKEGEHDTLTIRMWDMSGCSPGHTGSCPARERSGQVLHQAATCMFSATCLAGGPESTSIEERNHVTYDV